jgi:hypothetical protein
MKEDPIQYAKNQLIKRIDNCEEIIKETESQQKIIKQIDNVNNIKLLIKVYFSDEVQMDETPMGAMRRNQIRKELLDFANK